MKVARVAHAPAALVTATALLLAGDARASVYDIYGVNPRGLSMGQALTAAVDDYTATYYNPAALVGSDQMSYGIGFQASFPILDIERALPFCGAEPSECAAQHGDGAYSPFDSVEPDAFSGFTLGFLTPFGGIFEDRVAFGLTAYLPANNLVRAEGLDPQRPQYYVFQSLPDKFNVLGGLAYRPFDWVSLGLGIQVLANLNGAIDLDLDVLNHRFDRTDIVVKVAPKANVTAGLLFRPVEGLRLGVTYRGDLDLFYELPIDVSLGDPLDLDIAVSETVLYTPHQIAFGVSYGLEDPELLLSVDAVYALWSLAPDPSPQVAVDIGGDLLEGLGLGETLDVNTNTRPIDLAFVDTLSPRVGVEYTPLYWLTLRTGYAYRPTPAPRQTGATNYLDNDSNTVSLGVAFTFMDPLEVHPNPVTLELGSQLMLLSRRTIYKRDPADPVGDLSHGGQIFSAGVSVSHRY